MANQGGLDVNFVAAEMEDFAALSIKDARRYVEAI